MFNRTLTNSESIPQELKDRPQWVVWLYESREGEKKPTKVPYNARTGRRADSTDPRTWSTFDEALAAYEQDDWAGIGYVLSTDDPYTGVDLDHAIDSNGKVKPWAMYYVDGLDTYTEKSPSGEGLRLFTRASWPYSRHRKGDIEIYADKRFLTLTGNHLPDTPKTINNRAEAIPIIYADVFGDDFPTDRAQPSAQPIDLDDARLIEKAHAARYGADFAALWRGDTSPYSGDDSRADYHLVKSLLFWTGSNDVRAERLFRQSGLMRPKWDERRGETTYGERTMAAALQNLRAVYTPQASPNGHRSPVSPQSHPSAGHVSPESHETRETRPRFQILRADDLDTLPPVKWLVKDEIAAGQFSLFYGPSGGGKSFVALDWALEVSQEQPVIYVAAEDAQGYAARKIAWCKHHEKGAGQLYFVPEPVNLFDPAAVAAFVDEVARPLSPSLIIFDTLARCMTGADENSARDMGVVIENLEYIRHATGAAVVPVHHSGKNGATYRGSSALFGAAYTVIELESDGDLIKITCDKAKNSTKFKPRVLRLIQVSTGRETEDGEPETSCVAIPSDQVYTQGSDLTERQRQIVETLSLPVFVEAGAKYSHLQEIHPDIPRASLYRLLGEIMRKGYARQAAKGDPFYITAEGVAAVAESINRSNTTPRSTVSRVSPSLTLVS